MFVETDGVEPKEISAADADALFGDTETNLETDSASSVSEKRRRKLILVIDDSKMMRFAICELIGKMGYRTLEAGDSMEGFNKAMESAPDLIMLDIEMPVQNGIELLIELRKTEKHKTTPVIILTVSGERYDIEAANALNVADYMLKPPEAKKLESSIAKCLNLAG